MNRKTLPLRNNSRKGEMPSFTVVSHPESCRSFAGGEGDIIILPLFSGTVPGDYLDHLDEQLHHAIHKAMEDAAFAAHPGEVVRVDVSDVLGSAVKKVIFVVGLGEPGDFSSRTLCGLFSFALTKAEEEGVECLSFPIQPHRATEGAINLKGLAAILRCRTFVTVQAGGLKHLKEIRIVASPQAKRYIKEGLEQSMPLCSECGNFRLC